MIFSISNFFTKKTLFEERQKEVNIQNIVIKTRQYAKRQRTWSRGHMSDWQKFDAKALSKFVKKL